MRMYKPPNVISISSDEEDEEKITSEPPKADEVTLIAINRKRTQPEDFEDDLLVVEISDKEPLEIVTTSSENESHLKQCPKKREKTVGPLIDLLSDEEEEIVFRPVTLIANSKRMKLTQLAKTAPKTRTAGGINVDDDASITANDLIGEDVIYDISQTISAQDPILKTHSVTTPVSILNNYLKDSTKAIDTVKNKIVVAEVHSTLDGVNDTILINNNDDNDCNSSTTSHDDNTHHSTSNTTKAPEANFLRFKSFLRLCGSKITEAKMKKVFREKSSKFLKSYKTAGDFTSTATFQWALNDAMDSVRNSISGNDAVQKVLNIYNALKENRLEPTRTLDEDGKLDHLYDLLKDVSHRIKVLESAEVDYNEENNSSYCQLQAYRARAVNVHERICKRENKSKYLDRMTYSKLDFDRSSYQAFNVAINKKYKNNSVFPTFDDLNRLIRKTATKNQMEISEASLKQETKTCFVLLGELLQRRRKHELVDSLSDYVDAKATDPALKDAELDRKLRENKRVADKRTEEIIEKYCKIQESGCEPDLSSDPDDSNVELSSSSDEENNEIL